jgi:general secretion pathway protein F
MAKFSYQAKVGPGKMIQGVVEAESRADGVRKLAERGYFPVSVVEERGAHLSGWFGQISNRSLPRDLENFTRQLSQLLASGLPLTQALKVLRDQAQRPRLKQIVSEIIDSLEDGNTFSQSLGKFPDVFNEVYVNMIRAGEVGGHLELILERLADFSEQQDEIATRIKMALAYPLLMLLVGVATIVVLLTFVVPKIAEFFIDLGQALPVPTRLLMLVSQLLTSYGWFVLIVLVFLGMVARRVVRMNEVRHLIDAAWLKLPVLGALALKSDLLKLARTLGTLLTSGVPILKALQIAHQTMDNRALKRQLEEIQKEVAGGSSFAGSLGKRPLFPSFMVNLILIGEEGGRVEQSLHRIANTYERDTRRMIQIFTSLLEPGMILFIGLIVGFIVLAMMLPIFQINALIH